jgi:signal transduction histidine kinase
MWQKVKQSSSLFGLVLFIMLIGMIVLLFIGSTRLIDLNSEIAKNPSVYELSNYLKSYKIHFGESNCGSEELCETKVNYNDDNWTNCNEGNTAFRKVDGYKPEGGKVIYRLNFTTPEDLFNSKAAIAVSLLYIDLKSFRVFVNGTEISDVDGKLLINHAGIINLPRKYIGADKRVVLTILGQYQRDNTGISHVWKNLIGERKILEISYLSYERATNTYYLMFICLKLGILAIFILLFLFSETQIFLKYFIIYCIGVTFDAFFFVELFPAILRIPEIQFYAVFNLQLFGFFALWFLIESILESESATQRLVFGFFTVMLNLGIFLRFHSNTKINTKTLRDMHAFMLGYILVTIVYLLIKKYYSTNKEKPTFSTIRHLLIGFGLYLFAYLVLFLIESQTLNFRQPIDVVFFLWVSYMTVREFGANQVKIRDQDMLLKKQQLDVELGQATARIAHDLRKPFQNLKILVEAFNYQKECDSVSVKPKENLEDKIQCILPSIDFAEGLIEGVLDRKRAHILQLKKINVVELLDRVKNIHFQSDVKKNINFSVSNKTDGSLLVDFNKLNSVFQNLLNNAEEAMCKQVVKHIWIESNSFINSIGQTKCRIIIGNSGPPIPQDILTQLFIRQISYGKENGTGIGLNATKEIVESHQGEIAVRNLSRNRGVEFELIFSLYPPVYQEALPTRIDNNVTDLANNDSKIKIKEIKKIALIDDDELIHMAWRLCWPKEMIKQYLSPEEFLQDLEAKKINTSEFDIIITDFYFKAENLFNGVTLAKQLQSIGCRNILLTSGIDKDSLTKIEQSYFLDIIGKEILKPSQMHERFVECKVKIL